MGGEEGGDEELLLVPVKVSELVIGDVGAVDEDAQGDEELSVPAVGDEELAVFVFLVGVPVRSIGSAASLPVGSLSVRLIG